MPERVEVAAPDEQERLRRLAEAHGDGAATPEMRAAADAPTPVRAGLAAARSGPGAFPRGIGPAGFVAMQRLAGNRAMVQALGRPAVQRISLLGDPLTMLEEGVTKQGTESVEAAIGPGSAGPTAGAAGGSGEPVRGPMRTGAGGIVGGIGGAISGAGGSAAEGAAGAAGLGGIAGQVGEATGKLGGAGEAVGGVDHGTEAAGAGAEQAEAAGAGAEQAEAAGAEAAHGVGEGTAGQAAGGSAAEGAAGAAGLGGIAGQVGEATGKLGGAGEAVGGVDHGTEAAGAGAEQAEAAGAGAEQAEAAGAEAAHGVGEGTAGQAAGGSAAEGAAGAAGSHAAGAAGEASHGGGHAGGGPGGGGLGGAGGGAAGSEEIPEVAEPGDVAVKEIAGLGEKPPDLAAEEVKDPEAPEHEEPENLEAGAGEIERHAQSGGGGVVDVVINRALSVFRGITSRIGNGVRSAASSISSRVGGFFSQAVSFARNLVTTVTSGVRSVATGIATEIRTHLGSLKDGVKGIVSRVFGGVRNVMSQVGGAMRGAIIGILSGKPVMATILAPFKAIFGSLFGGIAGQITSVINRIRGVVDGAINRVLQTVISLTLSIVNGLTFLANLLTTAVTFLQQELTRLSNWVTEAVAGLPGVLRRVITAIVNAVISAARRLLNAIVARAQAYIARAIARVVTFVQRAISIATRIATAIRNSVRTVFDLVASGVRTVVNAIGRARTWLLGKVAAFVARALRAVLQPIAERLKQRLLALIGPAAGEAIRQAQLMFPNGLPAPQEVVQAAARGAQQVASEAGSAILDGLTNPEGDHIGFGIQLGGGGGIGGPVGASGAVTGMFDIVLDYRRNDIGFFLSPGAGAAGSLGIGEGAAAGVGLAGSWGTVATFGDKSSDVLSAYGGWFSNVSYGVSGGVADEIGAEASTGGSIYRGGATPGIPIVSYAPFGADQHPVPGTGTAPVTTAGTTTPGTPDAPGTLPLGEVRFPRQVSDVDSAPGGPGAVDAAATTVREFPSATPRGEVVGVDVLGEASRVWQAPGAGRTRAEENEALAAARARSVAGRLRGLVPGVRVTDHGNGDLRAASAGKSERDASPEDQRASMVASTVVRGTRGTTTPGTTTPGTPPTMAPDEHTFQLGSLPNPFQARQTTGWDTTASASFVVGAEAQVGGYLGLGASYSFPLGKTHLDPATMHTIRILTGFMKLVGDVETLSPLGFIRDALGLSAAFPERDAVIERMTSVITDWTIPLPPGSLVA